MQDNKQSTELSYDWLHVESATVLGVSPYHYGWHLEYPAFL